MNKAIISLEFFPPRNEAQRRRFWYTLGCLQTLNPSYISITWGALGTASQASLDLLADLTKDSSIPITAHLSCAGQSRSQMLSMIERLEELGIKRFLALRGDLISKPDEDSDSKPIGGSDSKTNGEPVLSHASELVSLLATSLNRDISVAAYPEAHPESDSQTSDIKWLKHKLDAGAARAVTQFFFEPATFLRFRDAAVAAGITKPLVPGILPIHDIDKVMDFSSKCGAQIPEHLIRHFRSATTTDAKRRAAVDHCVSLCQTLQNEGVDEFHLYTLNQAPLAYAVGCELLGKTAKAVEAA